ncbi:hypothetical protein ACFPFQ_42240, partial [Pseudonocardia sp. GCM10023141]
MTAVPISGLDPAPTTHRKLLQWVREIAELTTPDQVLWCDGSAAEWQRLTRQLVDAGTFENDNPIWPHCDGLIWPHPGSCG